MDCDEDDEEVSLIESGSERKEEKHEMKEEKKRTSAAAPSEKKKGDEVVDLNKEVKRVAKVVDVHLEDCYKGWENFKLTSQQELGMKEAMKGRSVLFTGGPGSGKTIVLFHIMNMIVSTQKRSAQMFTAKAAATFLLPKMHFLESFFDMSTLMSRNPKPAIILEGYKKDHHMHVLLKALDAILVDNAEYLSGETWECAGGVVASASGLTSATHPWGDKQIIAAADFHGPGHTSLLWQGAPFFAKKFQEPNGIIINLSPFRDNYGDLRGFDDAGGTRNRILRIIRHAPSESEHFKHALEALKRSCVCYDTWEEYRKIEDPTPRMGHIVPIFPDHAGAVRFTMKELFRSGETPIKFPSDLVGGGKGPSNAGKQEVWARMMCQALMCFPRRTAFGLIPGDPIVFIATPRGRSYGAGMVGRFLRIHPEKQQAEAEYVYWSPRASGWVREVAIVNEVCWKRDSRLKADKTTFSVTTQPFVPAHALPACHMINWQGPRIAIDCSKTWPPGLLQYVISQMRELHRIIFIGRLEDALVARTEANKLIPVMALTNEEKEDSLQYTSSSDDDIADPAAGVDVVVQH